jgi:hypothetical protein
MNPSSLTSAHWILGRYIYFAKSLRSWWMIRNIKATRFTITLLLIMLNKPTRPSLWELLWSLFSRKVLMKPGLLSNHTKISFCLTEMQRWERVLTSVSIITVSKVSSTLLP